MWSENPISAKHRNTRGEDVVAATASNSLPLIIYFFADDITFNLTYRF